MKRVLALLFACLALAVVAAGCGGDDSDDGGDDGGAAAPAETQEQPAPEAEEPADSGGGGGSGPQVSMKDIKFNPGTLKIKAGQTVTWTNDDTVGHDVTGDDFSSGDPGGIDGGGTYQHAFKKAGTYDYVCSVHPGMKGAIKVK